MVTWKRLIFHKSSVTQLNLTKGLTKKEKKRALPSTADKEFVQNCLSSLLKLSFPSHLLEHPNPQLLDRSQKERQKKNRNQTIYTENISKEM